MVAPPCVTRLCSLGITISNEKINCLCAVACKAESPVSGWSREADGEREFRAPIVRGKSDGRFLIVCWALSTPSRSGSQIRKQIFTVAFPSYLVLEEWRSGLNSSNPHKVEPHSLGFVYTNGGPALWLKCGLWGQAELHLNCSTTTFVSLVSLGKEWGSFFLRPIFHSWITGTTSNTHFSVTGMMVTMRTVVMLQTSLERFDWTKQVDGCFGTNGLCGWL